MKLVNRREFIFSAASFCAADVLARPTRGTYSVVLIGDTHFDSPDPLHYHRAYVGDTTKARFEGHKREHVRNSEMWRERLPRLLTAAGRSRRADAAFVLQLGDLVQGDCGDGTVHRQMLEDAVGAVKRAIPDLPFVTVCGNHDIRGTGAQLAYNRYMPGVLAKELGVPVERTTFSFRQGPDVFIVADFNVRETVEPGEDYARIVKLLDESRDARHTFVVSHGPLIAAHRWSLLGSKSRDVQRRELIRLLAARNAIVLAGHTHVMEYDGCRFAEGRIMQAVVNSVWTASSPASLVLSHDRPEQFADAIRKKQGRAKDDLLAYVADFEPALRRHWRSSSAGHAQLEVSDEGVFISYYPVDSSVCARRERLGAGNSQDRDA